MIDHDLLLVGAGPAHLGVLRRWALIERPAGRIALVASAEHTWHAGMLPGLVGGRYSPEDCQIGLRALCQAAQVELIVLNGMDTIFCPAAAMAVLCLGRLLLS